ncbi:MAG: hypothetical protein M3Y33_21375, partial [Actinomycetota bacterium]|nr:hypothetical protein [Actinomycetota bacterium]
MKTESGRLSGGRPAQASEIHLSTPDGGSILRLQNREGTPAQRLIGDPNRGHDAEFRMIQDVKKRLQAFRDTNKTEPTGVVVIGADKLMCPSCVTELGKLSGDFPGILVVQATESEIPVVGQHEAEMHPAAVFGTSNIGQLDELNVGPIPDLVRPPDAGGPVAAGTQAGAPLADARIAAPGSDPALAPSAGELASALDPAASPQEFLGLLAKLRLRAGETGLIQAVVVDAAGQVLHVEGGTHAMTLSLSDIQMAPDVPGGAAGRVLVRSSPDAIDAIDVSDPLAAGRLTDREHLDRTIILPPAGNPVQLTWTARADEMAAGVYIRPHYSPEATELGGFLEKVRLPAGEYMIAGHGDTYGIVIGDGKTPGNPAELTPQQIAAVVPETPDGTNYIALVCNFGGKAQDLANFAGRSVEAADTKVWVNSQGGFIADQAGPNGRPASIEGPSLRPAGTWRRSDPGGTVPAEVPKPDTPDAQSGSGAKSAWRPLGDEPAAPVPPGPGSQQHEMIHQPGTGSEPLSPVAEAISQPPVARAQGGPRGFLPVRAADLGRSEARSDLDLIRADLQFPAEVPGGITPRRIEDLQWGIGLAGANPKALYEAIRRFLLRVPDGITPRQVTDLLQQMSRAEGNLKALDEAIRVIKVDLAAADQSVAAGRPGARPRAVELRRQLGELTQLEREAPVALAKLAEGLKA